MAIVLNNGFKMPMIGLDFGETKDIKNAIFIAIKIGFRHFQCTAVDENEAEVGDALAEAFQKGLVNREELFITTKISPLDHGRVFEACKDSLKKLRLDYLDLYLYDLPTPLTGRRKDEDGLFPLDTTISLETTWHAMEDLVSMGLVRSIGISDHGIFLTRDCLAYAKVKPAVNQIQMHPFLHRGSLVKFCQKHGVCVSHTALAEDEYDVKVFCLLEKVPILQDLAKKLNKTIPQIIARWAIQINTAIILLMPESPTLEILKMFFGVFDFELAEEDMDTVKTLDHSY